MAGRADLLKVLQTRFECPTSWDAMAGGDRRRFCGQCQKEVFDFAQMEPRAVRARIAASRGQLCARMTREDGRLKMLAPAVSPEPAPRNPERAPALAASFFGAWLSLAAAAGASPADEAPVATEVLVADPQDQNLAAVTNQAVWEADDGAAIPADFDINQVTMGIVVAVDPKLHELFDDSELVAAATVGKSEVVAVEDDVAEVRTLLRVDRIFKGAVQGRWVIYHQYLPVEAFDPDLAEPVPDITPGTKMVAFLERQAVAASPRPVYEAVAYSGGLRAAAPDDYTAYVASLGELSDLRREAGPSGTLDPAGLMEWLVATAENPLTRKETLEEIGSALADFETLAQQDEETEIGATAVLGATFTEEHKERLVAALFASERLDEAGIELYRFVRDELDEAAARRWLIRALRRGEGLETESAYWLLKDFAEGLSEDQALAFLEAAEERIDAVDELLADDESPAAESLREGKRQEVAKALMAELASLLAQAGVTP